MKVNKSKFVEAEGPGYLTADEFRNLTSDQMWEYLEWYPNSSHYHIYNELYGTDKSSVNKSKKINIQNKITELENQVKEIDDRIREYQDNANKFKGVDNTEYYRALRSIKIAKDNKKFILNKIRTLKGIK